MTAKVARRSNSSLSFWSDAARSLETGKLGMDSLLQRVDYRRISTRPVPAVVRVQRRRRRADGRRRGADRSTLTDAAHRALTPRG